MELNFGNTSFTLKLPMENIPVVIRVSDLYPDGDTHEVIVTPAIEFCAERYIIALL